MGIISTPWEEWVPPDYVNEEGVEWWEVPDFSKYLKQKKLYNEYRAYFVKQKNGDRGYVLINRDRVVFETNQYEWMLYRIDAIWLSKTL